MSDQNQNQQPLFALSDSFDAARDSQIQRTQDSGILDRYIYDSDNVGDFLVHGKTTLEAERIMKAVQAVAKFAQPFREKL